MLLASEELAASARAHEERGEQAAARDDWVEALKLIPADASQAAWVRAKLDELNEAILREASKNAAPAWTRKLGPLAPIALLLLKGKAILSLLKLKFLLSFATFLQRFTGRSTVSSSASESAALVPMHELGHYVEVAAAGLTAHLPMFIPGFGAYVRWTAAGTTADTRAMVSLAGPLAGALGAALCALIWMQTRERVWIALSSFSAFINLMNLTPVWTLDGAQAMAAINRAGRIGIAIAGVLFAAYFSQPLLLLVVAVRRLSSVRQIAFAPRHAAELRRHGLFRHPARGARAFWRRSFRSARRRADRAAWRGPTSTRPRRRGIAGRRRAGIRCGADSPPVSGRGIAAGHYLAEEAPEEVLAELLPFLTGAEA